MGTQISSMIEEFWNSYLLTLEGKPKPDTFSAWSFGNTPEMQDSLAQLVLRGPKRATTSLKWIYDYFPNEKIPKKGDFSIVLDSKQRPVCIIETVEVKTVRYCDVDDKYASIEGEGDQSLNYWREVHWKFFEKECQSVGKIPSEEMPVICEIFRLVFPNHIVE